MVESDKATVEVPSSIAGTVESIQVKEGDTVKEGVVLIKVKQHLHLVRQLRRSLLQQQLRRQHLHQLSKKL